MTDERSEADRTYDTLKAAVTQNARGRWFLEEFARRNRVADTKAILQRLDEMAERTGAAESDGRIEYLQSELRQMADQINETRQEIASIKPAEGGNNRIMAATEELDAIISSTERATAEILTHAEKLQALGEEMREAGVDADYCETIEEEVTQIFMACSFQDITGQRTTKVVNVLRYLEARINGMISIWGEGKQGAARADLRMPKFGDSRADAHLLNGPAADGQGISQDDVDRMLTQESSKRAAPPKGEGGESPSSQEDIDALFR